MSAPSPAPDDDFSVLVLASDLGVDARPFLSPTAATATTTTTNDDLDNWHDCAAHFADRDFSDLESLQFLRVNGSDVNGDRILRVNGKCFPAQVVSAERLKKYVFYKIYSEFPKGPFCIVYMHTTVQKEDNSPGMTILRWIYEDLPSDIKQRLQVVYFLHPTILPHLEDSFKWKPILEIQVREPVTIPMG